VLTGEINLIPGHIKDIEAALEKATKNNGARQANRMAVIPSLVETMEATVALEDKQVTKAKEHALKAIALIPGDLPFESRMLLQGAAGYRLALAHRELGELDQACTVLLAGLEMLKSSKNYFGAAATILQIAAIYERSGKSGKAVRLCQETLDYMAEHQWGNVPPCGFVYLCLAGLLADSGDFEAAKRNLAVGRELVEPIESQFSADQIERAEAKLREAKISPQGLVEPLSPRELEVLQLIAEGCSNREIGQRLYLALDTVKGHNRNIYGKLGVHRRTEAIVRANELGIL
jgi:ATP/maltotriose-dependent transcriptional regulator MalT